MRPAPILIWLPAVVGADRRGRCRRRARAAVRARSARWARSASRSAPRRLRLGRRPGCSTSPTRSGSRELGIHYKLGIDGLNMFLLAADDDRCSPPRCLARRCASGSAPRLFFFQLRARRDGGARRASGAGPGAVRRLLRPDADPVLLPDRDVGRGADRVAGDDEARDLHARRLAADARRGGRDRRARRRQRRRPHHVRALGPAAQLPLVARLAGVDLPAASRPRSW